MIRLSRTGIRNLTANDVIYARGLNDYKENHVVNATWSNIKKQYRITVRDNFEYTVTIQELEGGSFEHACNCSEHLKGQSACKHVVSALFFVLNYIERASMKEPEDPTDKTAYNIIEYFSNQVDIMTQGETFHIDVSISIPAMLRNDVSNALVSLRVGNHRSYKVSSIKKFIQDFYKKENILLGKEFKYIHGESKLDKRSKKIMDYFLEIYEIQEAIDKLFYSKLFSKSQIILSKNMLFRLLEILEDQEFSLELYGKNYEDVKYLTTNPSLKYDLSLDDESIIMDYVSKSNVIPITESGELLFHDGNIYRPTKRFLGNYLPFYKSLGSKKEPLAFRGVQKNKFLENVLPKISETFELEVPSELKDRFIIEDLKAIIYLDKEKNYIRADLKYKYGDYEFNAFESPNIEDLIIVRQPLREEYFTEYLVGLGFQPKSNSYILRNEEQIYEFITDKVHELANECELFYSTDFKKINIKSPGSFKAGLKVGNGVELLEMNLQFDEVPKDELKEMFRSYRLKKKYYRLKNGSFVNLNEKNLDEVWDIIKYLNLSSDDLDKESIELSKNTAVYLNSVFEEKNLEVEKNEDFTELVDQILNPSTCDYEVPQGINATLRPYQVSGYKWLRTLARHGLGGILADDMGLGKTLQTIVYMAAIKQETKTERFLIVCPSSLIYNWQDELENFAPSLSSEVVTGAPKERQDIIEREDYPDVLITSYPLIRRDIAFYEKIKFHTVFIDEAQYIKNADSLNAKSVKQLISWHKFALTGTPIENSLSELWSIFDFIMPNYLLSHTKFVNQYEKPIMKDEEGVLDDLNRRIIPFVLRRMKKDVLHELPDKVETKMLTDMEEEQRKVYLSYMDNIRKEIQGEIEENGIEKSKMKILAALTRLRQICCHPGTFIENYNGGSGKLELLLEILDDAIANGHRILIFSQFTSMLSIIDAELKKRKIDGFYLEGSTKIKDRNDYVKRFNQGEGKVFLISLKAGGTGLNLVGADTVIHYDPWWNPAVEEQATDRAYRIGQVNSVHVIKLITKGTIEEKIYKLQLKKKDLSNSVIQSKEVFINALTKEELEDIFR